MQEEFVLAGTDPWEDQLYQLFHGGYGAGKTWAGVLRDILLMSKMPGCMGMITVPVEDMFYSSVLPVIRDVMDAMGMVEGRQWEWIQTRRELHLRSTGSWAIMRSTDRPERLRGPSLSWFHMEEARDSPFAAFKQLLARNRQAGFFHSGHICTTPPDEGEDHWLWKVFYGDALHDTGEELPVGRYVGYQAATRDNPHGGERHARMLERVFGRDTLESRRDLGGEFVRQEGLVHPGFMEAKHVKKEESWPEIPRELVFAGMDFGWTNPAAILVLGLDSAGRVALLDEFYARHTDVLHLGEEAVRLRKMYGIKYFIADSAEPGSIRILQSPPLSLPVVHAYKLERTKRNPHTRIGLTNAVINRIDQAGECMFMVSPQCRFFVREIKNYVQKGGREGLNLPELPQEKGDHLMHCFQYAVTWLEMHYHFIMGPLRPGMGSLRMVQLTRP